MRESLRASLAADQTFEGYPKGSIVVCGDCWKPVYALERGIGPGDRGGRAASAFRPLTPTDCADLLTRRDLDTTWQRLFAAWCNGPDFARLLGAPRPVSGSAAICPLCGGLYVKFRAVTLGEALDQAYVLEMATIPPHVRAVNSWLGERTRWVAGELEQGV